MIQRWRSTWHRYRQSFDEWWQSRLPATRAIPHYLQKGFINYARTGSRMSAALAYYAIFSVFPLLLLMTVAIGNLVGPTVAQQQIVNGISLFLPVDTVSEIQDTINAAVAQSSSFGLIAALGLLWAATGLFTNITIALDNIFEVPALRSMWRQRLLAIGMGLTLVVLVSASFVTTGVLRLVSILLFNQPSIWLSIGLFFLPLGLDVVIFALLFRFVPSRRVEWDAIWPAAVLGATGWELAKRAFEWYLTNLNNYSVIYGSIATGIILLFWAFLIASIFLISAEFCARANEWLTDQSLRPPQMIRLESDRYRRARITATLSELDRRIHPRDETALLASGQSEAAAFTYPSGAAHTFSPVSMVQPASGFHWADSVSSDEEMNV